jgi:TP901-1 family phage major tail protein
MVAQKGKDLLIRIDMDGNGSFTTFAGLRASRISFNAGTVDITNIASAGGWRELLPETGIRSATVSGSGVFLDQNTVERAQSYFFNADIPDFEFFMPAFGMFRGPFQITSLEMAGNFDGEATYEITLTSGGEITVSPPPPPPPGGGI